MTSRHTRRWSLTSIVALVASVLVALMVPAAVMAHASQIGSTPLDGEVVATAPASVTVEFDSELLPMGAALVVRAEDDTIVTTAEPVVADSTLTVATDPAAMPGSYRVAYRAVSADGHTIQGSFAYVVEGPAVPVTEPSSPQDQSAPATQAPESAPASDQPAPVEAAPAVTDEGSGPGLIIAIGVAIGVAILVAGIVSALLLRT